MTLKKILEKCMEGSLWHKDKAFLHGNLPDRKNAPDLPVFTTNEDIEEAVKNDSIKGYLFVSAQNETQKLHGDYPLLGKDSQGFFYVVGDDQEVKAVPGIHTGAYSKDKP